MVFAGDWDHTKVIGSEACGECHGEAVSVWEQTHHYGGLSEREDGEEKAEEFAEVLGIDDYTEVDAVCTQCHATVGIEDEGETDPYVLDEGAVNCESCHSPANDWLEVHSNFGGNDISREEEDPAHREQRLAEIDAAGMLRPVHTYALAKNCMACHLVSNEALVNMTDHPAGSDFELVAWTQGEIRHNFTASGGENNDLASIQRQRVLFALGAVVELEGVLNALSDASDGEFKTKMLERAENSIARLDDMASATSNAEISAASELAKTAIRSGDYTAGGELGNLGKALSTIDPDTLNGLDEMLPTEYQGEPGE